MNRQRQTRHGYAEVGSNTILEALSPEYRSTLFRRMELVSLPASHALLLSRETPRYAHFLVSGLATLTVALQDGEGLDTSLVSSEGLVETVHLFGPVEVPVEAVMLVHGAAYRIAMSDLRAEFLANEELRAAILTHFQRQCLLANQLAACNYTHGVVARLARSLLMVADRVKQSEFSLTHGSLAQMLGVRRPTLTLAAKALQRQGVISYTRGVIKLCDQEALREQSCECHDTIARLYQSVDA